MAVILLSQAVLASDGDIGGEGQQLYKTYCSACHGISGGMDMKRRTAPPIIAVRMHYIGSYPDKMSFVMAIADWVEKQDENKSLMRGAIRKFNIMPPVSVGREDAEKIAAYIYDGDIEKPAGFDKHFEEMHGKDGMRHDNNH
jgi:cytochrome c